MKLKDLLLENEVIIPGVGRVSPQILQRDIQMKLQDLLTRAQQGSYAGISKTQFDMLALYWDALAKSQGGM